MNDQSAGWSPDSGDDDDPDDRRLRSVLERTLMDRARQAAERDRQKGPRRFVQHAVALAAALVLVVVIMLGFDAFLTSVQKLMDMVEDEGDQTRSQPAKPDPAQPIPAYVVPAEEPPPEAAP